MRWKEHVERKEAMRNAYNIQVGRGKRLFGRQRRKWKYNIKTDLEKILYDNVAQNMVQ